MSQQLPDARRSFVAAIQRDTPGTDLPRYTAVLDALLDWSAAHADRVRFRPGGTRADVLRFERTKTKEVFWSVQVVRGGPPKLEIHLAAGRPLSAEDRARAMELLNAHSRSVLEDGDRLRIGFGALKNKVALEAVLDLFDQLLDERRPAAEPEADGERPG